MIKYVIHACPKRLDYVKKYLIPSMEAQGITNIDLRCDNYNLGNLSKCMEIFESMRSDGGAWHIQDDVVICRDFKERTEQFASDNVVCGYSWDKDENLSYVGLVEPQHMWWSFPCIYIPNSLARECAVWFDRFAKDDPKYVLWAAAKRYDDFFFQEFLKERYPDDKVLNLKPNLVDHVDYLIGGSIVNVTRRDEQVRAAWFEDLDLVEALEKKFGYLGDEENNG